MVSAEFAALRQQIKENPMPTELRAMREAYEGMGQQYPIPSDAAMRPGILGERPCEWFDLPADKTPQSIVLYLHGGGYAIGSLNTHRHLGPEMAKQTGAAVVMLDYRLGPEHRFPAALHDAVSAYTELVSRFPQTPIALAGDSAGAGLVMATLVALKQRELPLPSCAYCMSPWVDLEGTGESLDTKAEVDPLASRAVLKLMAQRYLGAADPRGPLASPIYADLHGLPPLLIQVGSAEVLLDDAIRLAAVAGKADVDVSLEIVPEMIHVWPYFFPAIPEGRDALARACRFLARHLSEEIA